VLYDGRIIEFYEAFLGGEVVHYDNIWYRAMPPGFGTVPHSDIVYMSRGTHDLFTSWIPWGDIDLRTGGLIVLDESLQKLDRLEPYLSRDVDDYCSN